MRVILIACVTAAVIAVIGGFVMSSVQTPADEGFIDSSSVRLGA
jgi:hypothetical protein